MPLFRIEIETTDTRDYEADWDVQHKAFDTLEDASGWAYDYGDKRYYKIYEKVNNNNNNALQGYHWERKACIR